MLLGVTLPSAYSRLDQSAQPTPSPGASYRSDAPDIPVSYATPEGSARSTPQATPASNTSSTSSEDQFWIGASLVKGDGVERYVWDDSAVDFSGFGLVPVSLTIGNFSGSVQMYAEFTNVTDATLVIPMLDFEAVLDGKGFGTARAWGDQYEVLPGETATFTGHNFYGGAILVGDWDTFRVVFTEYPSFEDLSAEGLRLDVEEQKLFNDSDTDKSNVLIEAIMRDSDAVYVGTCHLGTIRATVPAGLFVRVPEDISLNLGPVSTCASFGAGEFTDRLGTGPVTTTEYIVFLPRP